MVGILRFLVGLLNGMALVAFIGMFVLSALVAASFDKPAPNDLRLFAAMLSAIAYFVGVLCTSLPKFPPNLLSRSGLMLHLLFIPTAIAFGWNRYNPSESFEWMFVGIVFAVLWFFMARSITSAVS